MAATYYSRNVSIAESGQTIALSECMLTEDSSTGNTEGHATIWTSAPGNDVASHILCDSIRRNQPLEFRVPFVGEPGWVFPAIITGIDPPTNAHELTFSFCVAREGEPRMEALPAQDWIAIDGEAWRIKVVSVSGSATAIFGMLECDRPAWERISEAIDSPAVIDIRFPERRFAAFIVSVGVSVNGAPGATFQSRSPIAIAHRLDVPLAYGLDGIGDTLARAEEQHPGWTSARWLAGRDVLPALKRLSVIEADQIFGWPLETFGGEAMAGRLVLEVERGDQGSTVMIQ